MPSPPALPCCRFLKTLSSPQRAHVTFFVKRDKLELVFWLLCSMHAVIQVHPAGVVGGRNCHCHSFAACAVDVTVCFSRQTVSALTSGLSRYFAQPTPCLLHLAYFDQKTGCWRNSCHRHPQSSPSPPWDFSVTQILPQHEPFCILSQHEVCYPCTVERRLDTSPFFLLLHTSLFETLLIHPCTML